MIKEWLEKKLKLSEEEIRAYAWILKETDGGERPLQTTMQEFKQATYQTKTFAGELLKTLATKGCIEYQRVEICKDCMLFIQVTELGKPPHELCDENPPSAPSPTPIDYRDVITDEADPEEDEREALRQAIIELDNEKDIVIEPWMLKFRLKPLALLYYAYAYSNRNSEDRWYERITDTCKKFEVKEATLALARNALTERGLFMREIPQRRASTAYPYIIKTEMLKNFNNSEEN